MTHSTFRISSAW